MANPIPRIQTRTTQAFGDPVPSNEWTITSDTGPISAVIDTITVVNQTLSVQENTATGFILSASDSNPSAVVTINHSNPANGALTAGTAPVLTTSQLSLIYTPNQNFVGQDSFTYMASDDKGAISGIATVTINVSAVTSSNVDAFGVKKLYADGPGPVTLMDMDDPTKTRGASPGSNPEGNSEYYPKFQKNSDGSWKNTNGKEVRWAWSAEDAYPGDSNICKCYDTDNRNGYMSGPNDWPPRVEMTGYYRSPPGSTTTNTSNGETHIEHVISGHRSTTSSTASGPGNCQLGCAGSYHCNLYPLTGRQKFEKDYHHSFAYAKDIPGVNNITATAKWAGDNNWHGFKSIFYILPDGATVQLEHWTDWNADGNWKKTHSFQDKGQWTPKASYTGCGSGPQTIVFLFGGPLIDFRADNWNNYDMKWLSIRSIDPTKPLAAREEHERELEGQEYVNPDDEIYQAKES